MNEILTEDKTFEKEDYKETGFPKGEYENCSFINCDFAGADFSSSRFIDCSFLDSNLSLVKLHQTIFRDTKFTGCKMLGLLFNDCNRMGLSFAFDNCTLNHSSFYKTDIKKTVFRNCVLAEVDWTDSDLGGSTFEKSDLRDAKFENTNLEKADFRTAFNYSLDPALNRVKKAKFSVAGLPGLLRNFDIQIEI